MIPGIRDARFPSSRSGTVAGSRSSKIGTGNTMTKAYDPGRAAVALADPCNLQRLLRIRGGRL